VLSWILRSAWSYLNWLLLLINVCKISVVKFYNCKVKISKLKIRRDFVPLWRWFNQNFNFISTLSFDVNSMLHQLYVSDWNVTSKKRNRPHILMMPNVPLRENSFYSRRIRVLCAAGSHEIKLRVPTRRYVTRRAAAAPHRAGISASGAIRVCWHRVYRWTN